MALHPFASTENAESWSEFQGSHRNGFNGSHSVGETRERRPGANGEVLMADTELEEGEACDDPESNCDPDTAFSYIDEKLRNVLGDVQKQFEGGVSAEKLGSKFGGYGSFLPTHERAPSLLLQSNVPSIPANEASQTKRSPSEGVVERIKKMATGGVALEKVRNGHGTLPNEDACKNSIPMNKNNGDTFFTTLKNSVVSDNICEDNKKVTLKIKMGSDVDTRRKNSAIYSGLGLEHSSSVSLEDDEDDQRSVSELESSPDRTPLSMIRIMTSYLPPEGSLLSPLLDLVCESFEQKLKVPFASKESKKTRLSSASKTEAAQGSLLTKNDVEISMDKRVSNEKKERVKEKRNGKGNEQKQVGDVAVEFSKNVKRDDLEKRSPGDNSQGILKLPVSAPSREEYKFQETTSERADRDAVSESGKGLKLIEASRERNGSTKDKDHSAFLEHTKKEVKDEQQELSSPFEYARELGKAQSKSSKSGKGVDFPKKIKRDDLEKRSPGDNFQGILKLPASAPLREEYKFHETVAERADRDAASESGKGLKSFEASREHNGTTKDRDHSTFLERTKREVKDEQQELSSPLEYAKELRKDHSKSNESAKGVVNSNIKDQFIVFDQDTDAGKEFASCDLVTEGRKQKEAYRDFPQGKKPSGTKEMNLAGKEKNSIRDGSKQSSKDKVARRTAAPDVICTDRELEKEMAGERKKKSKGTVKDGHYSRDLTTEKVKDPSKEVWKDMRKEENAKEILAKESMSESTSRDGRRDLTKSSVKDSYKEPYKELAKKEIAEQRKKEMPKEGKGSEPNIKDFSRLIEKDKERDQAVAKDSAPKTADSSLRFERDMAISCSDVQTMPRNVAGLPSGEAAPAPVVTAPVIIQEDWVQCDKCEQWRLLPPGKQPKHLPKKWRCKMLDWLEGMNNCSFTEEQTTQALYSLLGIPKHQLPAQVDPLAGQPPAGVAVVPSTDGKQENQNDESGGPKLIKSASGKKRKEPPTVKSDLGPSKSKNLNEVGQLPQESLRGKSMNEDLGHAVIEEKRKVNDKGKPKRFRSSEGRDVIGSVASPSVKDPAWSAATTALREAKDLKHHADRLKEKEGMERESTDLYLSAALKFLHAAALLEPGCSESAKNGDVTQSMKYYSDTAKLCEYCALAYERGKEMAAAALAYKCVGLAHMRVVLAKSVCMNRDRTELQDAYQLVLPGNQALVQAPFSVGESPSSSSASDVDNLNNHFQLTDRQQTTAAKSAASPSLAQQTAGNYIIPARCRPSYGRLLQFAADVNAALEALSKSENAYKAADLGSVSARYGEEGMVAVKRVVDCSFYDVKSVLRLVRLALEAIGR